MRRASFFLYFQNINWKFGGPKNGRNIIFDEKLSHFSIQQDEVFIFQWIFVGFCTPLRETPLSILFYDIDDILAKVSLNILLYKKDFLRRITPYIWLI